MLVLYRFVLAAVSPAVVVPCLLQLGEEGYGVEEGIPTLVIAAASLDDVLAITGFSVMLTLTFAQGMEHKVCCIYIIYFLLLLYVIRDQ